MNLIAQTLVGRVISRPTITETKNGYMLRFPVAVNSLVQEKGNYHNKKTGFVQCTYFTNTDIRQDVVSLCLANIYDEETDTGKLAGKTYKSVQVVVTGTPRLVETGIKGGGFYYNLEGVSVQIVDSLVMGLLRTHKEQQEAKEEEYEDEEQEASALPTRAPRHSKKKVLKKKKIPVVEEEYEDEEEYEVVQQPVRRKKKKDSMPKKRKVVKKVVVEEEDENDYELDFDEEEADLSVESILTGA